MTRLDPDTRLLDPVDPHAPETDHSALLQQILRAQVPPARARSRRRVAWRLGLVGAVGAIAGGVALAMPGGTGTDVVANAYQAVSQPDTVLHYTQELTLPARQGTGTRTVEAEFLQDSDGSDQRVVPSRNDADTPRAGETKQRDPGGWELAPPGVERAIELATPGNDNVLPDTFELDRVVKVDWDVLGDPHTLLQRARSGDMAVEELGAATVRGIPVLQFKLGECALVDGRIKLAAIVSVARDGFRLVSVEQPPCGKTFTGADGRPVEERRGIEIQYTTFEVLSSSGAYEENGADK